MNVLIANNHAMVREGVEQIIRTLPEIEQIEEVYDGNEALDKIRKKNYDLAILDVSMPGISGLDLLHRLKQLKNHTNVLLYSFYPQKQYAISALRLGAAGYLSEDCIYEELTTAIRRISKGEKYVSTETTENNIYK
jgi:two-component system, NarL family, invasion response regulator UvrY